jgi:hypothetical protein
VPWLAVQNSSKDQALWLWLWCRRGPSRRCGCGCGLQVWLGCGWWWCGSAHAAIMAPVPRERRVPFLSQPGSQQVHPAWLPPRTARPGLSVRRQAINRSADITPCFHSCHFCWRCAACYHCGSCWTDIIGSAAIRNANCNSHT